MKYLLDTDHWSYLQRRHPAVLSRADQLPEDSRLYMSVITQGELLTGVAMAAHEVHRQRLLRLYERSLEDTTQILPVTSLVAEVYATIFAHLKRSGRPIPTNDIWIAATALAYNMVLVSADAHFRLIEGLQVEDWTQP